MHPVRELLRSRHAVTEVLVATERTDRDALDDIRRLADAARVAVREVGRDEIERLAAGSVHQGVVARAPAFPYAELDDVLALADERGEPPLLVALDGVTDPHNVGSIARTAEALGVHGLIVPARRAAGVTPTVEKAAAGALAHLPLVRVTNLVSALRTLHDRDVWIVGLDADAPDPLRDCALLSEAVCLTVGSEGRGLARLTAVQCDVLVNVPMQGRVGSLNASVAAAVAIYEARRRRDGGPGISERT